MHCSSLAHAKTADHPLCVDGGDQSQFDLVHLRASSGVAWSGIFQGYVKLDQYHEGATLESA